MREAVRALGVMVEISIRADKWRSIAAVVTATGSMVTSPLRAIGLKLLTDGVVASSPGLALTGVLLVVGLSALGRLMFWASFNIRIRLRENTQMYLDAHIMDLTAGIPGLEHHERPEYLDNVELVRAERWALANPFNPISWSLASILQVAGVFVLLAGVHPLLLLLPVGGIPSILATLYSQRAQTRLRESQAEPNRLLRHLQDLTTDAAAAKEVRIFGLSGLLLERRRVLFRQLERLRVRQRIRLTAITACAWALFSACFVGAIAFTVDLALRGQVTVGSVMLVLGLGAQVNMLLAILVSNAAWLIRTQSAVLRLLWLRDYAVRAHSELEPAPPPRTVPPQLRDGIRLTGVSFSYPGTEQAVLEGVDLHLPPGSTVAIVGENGAGKTTLVKLLSRFYEPTAGAITVDGIDLRRFGVPEWRTRIAAGFQDFARLQLLARESIGVGDTDKIDRDAWIHGALSRAAASDVATALPHDLDTQLGRYFEGGVDLSIGQWQKVALGRAMMREQILLLMLDEPTASLDAPTEHALFEHFAQAARYAAASGAITLLVSHRFSTVRMADLILVISGGRVLEHGTHADLLGIGGLYAELYGLQASAYR